jgi:hypothetical protein
MDDNWFESSKIAAVTGIYLPHRRQRTSCVFVL